MAVQDVERAINTVADSMTGPKDISRKKSGTLKIQTPSGERVFKRPEIIRTARINGMVLSRDEVRAFARLKARGRALSGKMPHE